MSQRIVWPLALVAALVIVDGSLALLDRRSETRSAPAGGPLVPFDPAGVAKLTLTRPGKRPLVLSRAAQGAFVVATSKNYPARTGKVEATLTRLLGWKRGRVAGDKQSHETFCVVPDKGVSIKLEDFTGTTLGEIIMGSLTGVDTESARAQGGKIDPGTMGRLVRRVGEDEVYVVQDFVTGEFEPDAAEWIERPLLGGGDDARVRSIVMKRRGLDAPLVVHRDGPYLRLGDGHPADPDRVAALVHELLNAWATDTVEGEDDARIGLNPPRLAIQAEWTDGARPAVLLLGDEAAPATSSALPSVVARIPDRPGPLLVPEQAVATLSSASAESLALTKLLGEKPPSSIQRVTVREGTRTIVLAHETKGWSATITLAGMPPAVKSLEGAEGEARQKRCLNALTSLAITTFDRTGPGGHGLAQPAFTVGVELARDALELSFAAPETAIAWARRSDIPCALALGPLAVAELRAAFSALAD